MDTRSNNMEGAERWVRLTEKQRACLDLLLERKTSKQIARVLGIAKPTVDQRLAAARNILGAVDRADAALRYAALKATYDRVIYDPVEVPPPPRLVPSDFPDGDPAITIALIDRESDRQRSPVSSPPFGDLWSHDHAPGTRWMIMAAMLVVALFFILASLAIGQSLTRLISG